MTLYIAHTNNGPTNVLIQDVYRYSDQISPGIMTTSFI